MTRTAWIFQANRSRFDPIEEFRAGRQIDSWSVTRYLKQLGPGVPAALWIGGSNSGIYAVGRTTGIPRDQVTDSRWKKPEDRGRVMTFCPLRLEFLPEPIARSDLLLDVRFREAQIIKQPWAGNPFALTEEQWQAVVDRLPERFAV